MLSLLKIAEKLAVLSMAFLSLSGCREHGRNSTPIYKLRESPSNLLDLKLTTDTVHFFLSDDTYNQIKSFNTFIQNSSEYISFYERRSESIVIYDMRDHQLIKKIKLSDIFNKKKLYKTSVYCKNFDSLFITNADKLYLVDSFAKIKMTIKFIEHPKFAWAYFDNINKPVFVGNKLFTGVRMYAQEKSLKQLRKWKVLYEFNLDKKTAALHYNIPSFYHHKYYGRRLLVNSFCFNNQNKFVFNFAVDTVLYETDLNGTHYSYSSHGRRQGPILDISETDLINDQGSRIYYLNDTYDALYYDRVRNRYLRIMKKRITLPEYEAKNKSVEQAVVILDKDFQVVGETPIQNNVYLKRIFFTNDGNMYAQVNPKDEYRLSFIRMEYQGTELQKIAAKGVKMF